MQFTTICRIPQDKLHSIEANLESLNDGGFERLDLAGVNIGYWAMLAMSLNLGFPVASSPIAFDERGGLAVFEWDPAFIRMFVNMEPDEVDAAVSDLHNTDAMPGVDLSLAREAVRKLRSFLAESELERDAVVEYATF